MRFGGRISAALLLVAALDTVPALAQTPAPPTFESGDIFQSIGSGLVYIFRLDPNTGQYTLISAAFDPQFASFRTTGSAFDKRGNFFVTLFNNQGVGADFTIGPILRFPRDYNPAAGDQATVMPTYGNSPESVVFDAAGNMYVGHKNKAPIAAPCVPPPPGVTRRGDVITKIAPDGSCIAAFDVEREGARRPSVPAPRPDDTSDPNGDSSDPQGADWIDLASDQRTLFYTSAGRRIMRFDTITGTQLPDFANLTSEDVALQQVGLGQLFALRILADGGVLVADNFNIKRLNAAGAVLQTYDLGPAQGFAVHDNWFSLNLDPDGESFWSGDGRNGQIHKFSIATGTLLATIDTPFADTFFGVSVFDELVQGLVNVSGRVYVDANKSRIYDAAEPGISGVAVTLAGTATGGTTVAAMALTLPDGTYSFTAVPAGQYSVSSPSTAGTRELFTSSPLPFALAEDETKTDLDFGYVSGTISGVAYVDANGNGARDLGETGIPNVLISLVDGSTTSTGLTNADGRYEFNLLRSGQYSVTAPGVASGKALSSLATLAITLVLSEDRADQNFGYRAGAISGFAFVDGNRNGVRDAGEPGLDGVQITLTGQPGGSATTDVNGAYSFTQRDAGDFSVGAPPVATGKALGTPASVPVTLNPGQTLANVNFGYVLGAISGVAYLDANGNGIRDVGEAGIAGVALSDGQGNTATTLGDGSYTFTNLNAGGYTVSAPAIAGGNTLGTPSPLGALVAAGLTTFSVDFGYVAAAPPSLSLAKRANPTSFSKVGETIVYTYVVGNTGSATVEGPITVTDDKLGKFECSAAALAGGESVSCTRSYVIQASDLGTVVSLPTAVPATIYTGAWLQGRWSTQATRITGAGPGVPDGTYPGWCIQDHVQGDLHNEPATLYSSIGGNLPPDLAVLPWNQINYVLNHKIHGPGRSDSEFVKDVQTAIWLLLGEPNPDFGVSDEAAQMVTEALAHATYVPGPGEVVATVVYSDGVGLPGDSIQESIVEMTPALPITNHAIATGTFRGGVVPSNEAEATVTQVFVADPPKPVDDHDEETCPDPTHKPRERRRPPTTHHHPGDKNCKDLRHHHRPGDDCKPPKPVHHPGDRNCRNPQHHHPANDDCKPKTIHHAGDKNCRIRLHHHPADDDCRPVPPPRPASKPFQRSTTK